MNHLPPTLHVRERLLVDQMLAACLASAELDREFRELALMCAVYNIKNAAEQEVPIHSGD